ncbi:MAG: PQQ-binding-like beta-propeller repeat protein, partial [Planctomycetota bacterium]|nr:PQQ-binding-like beta-propeller repeat protein [Planctomycetota bacterium]
MAFEPGADGEAPKQVWFTLVQSTPTSLLAGDDRLFVVTREGNILCYGPEKVSLRNYPYAAGAPRLDETWTEEAKTILEQTGVAEGYCLAFGTGTGGLVEALAEHSKLQIFAIESDAAKAQSLRHKLIKSGLYGNRVTIIVGDLKTMPLPPYLANLIVSEDPQSAGIGNGAEMAKKLFHSLRPYGGVACLPLAGIDRAAFKKSASAGLDNAQIKVTDSHLFMSREGALPGSANWTHPYCDSAKSNLSRDERVKLPLGLLWFGGISNENVLPRHGLGPVPQVVDGRLFIEGPDGMNAIDIYTGRTLWQASLPGLGLPYDTTHHQPIARASGGNYASTPDGIYISYNKTIVRLDPVTGERISRFGLPENLDEEGSLWGALSVWQDLVIAGVVGHTSRKRKSGHDRFVYFSSEALVALDRKSGKVEWQFDRGYAHHAIAIGRGRVYLVAGPSRKEIEALKRRGETSNVPSMLYCLDAMSGKEL